MHLFVINLYVPDDVAEAIDAALSDSGPDGLLAETAAQAAEFIDAPEAAMTARLSYRSTGDPGWDPQATRSVWPVPPRSEP